MTRNRIGVLTLILILSSTSGQAAGVAPEKFRQPSQAVPPVNESTILCEAEEFKVESGDWKARPFGENYYVATFANAFLSRKAFLGAPEQCKRSVATINVNVPAKGRYLALIRYEAVFRFQTRFTLQIEQGGKVKLKRLYGARENLKIWAFRQKLKNEVAWSWGAGENVVWEGHDAFVDLDAGPAKLSLIAEEQPKLAARRNVDLVMLTSDVKQVQNRIEKENYLPLDGMLTQAGDVYLKVHNQPGSPDMKLIVPNGTEHSPYWVHIRNWKPKNVDVKSGQTTEWIEVGSLLDTLSDGQWKIQGKATGVQASGLLYHLEFGVKNAAGRIESIALFKNQTGDVELAYDADTRYSRRIRLSEQVLYELIDFLEKHPVRGKPLKETLLYGYTFTPRAKNAKYNKAIDEFIKLMGATAFNRTNRKEIDTTGNLIRGYIDVRGRSPAQLEKLCEQLKSEGKANKIAVVSLGDEIGLRRPPANDHAAFQAWLKTQKLKPQEVDPKAKAWTDIKLNLSPTIKESNPALYYLSKIYSYRYGIAQQKKLTDVLKKHLPHAGIGANFSPHHGHMYLGPTHQWISLFREDGMTMPWGEDYIWQVPVGTQQMNSLMIDMYRCALKGKPDRKIHYYVMPHTPGNTLASWRRQFYGDIAHGTKIFNLFEIRPVQAAYTENHCSMPEMYQEIRKSVHELGLFEDIVQSGQVKQGLAGLWFSEAADVWDDYAHPMGAAKRCLYMAIRHIQVPLDCVLDGDDLSSYKVLYLTDRHVTRSGSKAIAEWVKKGGKLFATAGAGMYDEFNQPNEVLRELMGVDEQKLTRDTSEEIIRAKEHLPYAKKLDTVTINGKASPVFGAKSTVKQRGGKVIGRFADGSPAVVTNQSGKGETIACAFLPGLSYFHSALPVMPVDRGASADTLSHFVPTDFDKLMANLIAMPAKDLKLPVTSSVSLVETTVIESKKGTVIPLVNWSGKPVKGLTVSINIPVPASKVTRATGKAVQVKKSDQGLVLTLDLDVADALILR